MRELEPAPQASVLGRAERVDMASAALLNGITSHTFDFDDTHLRTIIHPAGPVASAALALAEHSGMSGRELIDALVLGIDVACRVGNASIPITTTAAGTSPARPACSARPRAARACWGSTSRSTTMALGIAASQPIGVREQFGTMTKPFHPGAAARAGLMSALLAKHGFTARTRALEAPRGLLQTYSAKCDWSEIHRRARRALRDLDQHVQAVRLRHRHPSEHRRLHAAARRVRVSADDIERVELDVHPLVLELTGKRTPRTGSKASSASITRAPPRCCSAWRASRSSPMRASLIPRVIEVRDRVHARADTSIDEAAAEITLIAA